MKTVIVTGALGFIGSHTCKAFKEAGYHVIGIDKEFRIPEALLFIDEYIKDDFANVTAHIAKSTDAEAIIHIAGTSLVGPSIYNPGEYYDNNCAKTNRMLDDLKSNHWQGAVVFSSSAAVYGNGCISPIVEAARCDPVSPYGNSKLICEEIIRDHCYANTRIKGIALRYFNACGCDVDGKLGNVKYDSHIIPRIIENLITGEKFTVFGREFDTEDRTCVRDYLHVSDIASAHVEAVELAKRSEGFEFYNLGTGQGHSNLEVIIAAEKATNKTLNFTYGPMREGDPDELIANPMKFVKATNWKPMHSNLAKIITTTYDWMKNFDYSVE